MSDVSVPIPHMPGPSVPGSSVPSSTVPSLSSPGPGRSIAGVVEALSGRGEGFAGSGSAAIVAHDGSAGTTPRVVATPTLPGLATVMVLLPDATQWAEPDSCDQPAERGPQDDPDEGSAAEPDAFPRWSGPNGTGSWLVQPYGEPLYVESINLPACPTVAQALDIAAAQIACALWIVARRRSLPEPESPTRGAASTPSPADTRSR